MRVVDVGPLARLVEVAPGEAARWAHALRAEQLPGIVDVVPAAQTVLVHCADRTAVELLDSRAPHVTGGGAGGPLAGRVVEIPVVYDGDDLDRVASATGLQRDEVVARHVGSSFRVDFCGFAPGFAYLSGLDDALWLPRQATPRTRVPAGSVAIAAAWSAVYPGVSPGGWHLLGRTTVPVWDVDRDPPALLEPGSAVRFVVA